jgi:hypothetical protein
MRRKLIDFPSGNQFAKLIGGEVDRCHFRADIGEHSFGHPRVEFDEAQHSVC